MAYSEEDIKKIIEQVTQQVMAKQIKNMRRAAAFLRCSRVMYLIPKAYAAT